MSDKVDLNKESAPKKISIKNTLEKIPKNISEGIENGGGDEVIVATQDMLGSMLSAPDKSCQIVSQQIVLLTEDSVDAFVKKAYLYAAILSGSVVLQMLLFEFTWKLLIRAAVFILAAFTFDIVVRRNARKSESKKESRVNKNRNNKQSSDDDIII